MNLRMTLPVLLAALLAGCDSSSTTTGTSSETVTGLQILANSAEAIVSRIPTASSARAARSMNMPDSLKPGLDSMLLAVRCAPAGRTTSYGRLGEYGRFVRSASAGLNGKACSLESGWYWGESKANDSTGWHEYAGIYSDSGVRYVADPTFGNMALPVRIEFVGKGTWRLRSGVTLVYDSMYAQFAPQTRFAQRIRFGGTCRVELDFDLSVPVDAPVWCGDAKVGRFLWDNVGMPVVMDMQGGRVAPQEMVSRTYAEDSIGLWVDSLQASTAGGVLQFCLRLGWKLMEGDVLEAGDTVALGLLGSGLPGKRLALGADGRLQASLLRPIGANTLMLTFSKPGFDGAFRLPLLMP